MSVAGARVAAAARVGARIDGRFELYKISAKFEGEETRRVHGLPSQAELAV